MEFAISVTEVEVAKYSALAFVGVILELPFGHLFIDLLDIILTITRGHCDNNCHSGDSEDGVVSEL